MGLLGSLGGARPTGLTAVDAVLLGLGGLAMAACARRARTVPVYVAAATAGVLQPALIPLALAVIAIAAVIFRRAGGPPAGILAGGLAWAAAVGAPLQSGARHLYVPMLAMGWVVLSARANGSRRFRQRLGVVVMASVGVAAVGVAVGALSVISAKSHADRGAELLETGLDAARQGDTETAINDLRAAERALTRGGSNLGAVWAKPAWLVPGLSQNVRILHSIVDDVATLASVGVISTEEADLDSLRARSGEIDLQAVADVEAPLQDVLDQLSATRSHLEAASEDWLAPPVRTWLDTVQAEVDDALPSARLALEGVRLAPTMFGGDGTRTYLVLFTTPVEARSRTGFPGNYAEVTFTDGHFEKTRFGRVSELNAAGLGTERSLDLNPDYEDRYGRFDPADEWRSVTFSPDFPTVADIVRQLYPQSGGQEIDGVMSVDPLALAALLNFTGPIAVPDIAEPLDATTAAQFLLRDQYIQFPDSEERIDTLESLSDTTFDRLTRVELPGPREMGDVLGPLVTDQHLQVVSFDDEAMTFIDHLGLSGRFPAVEGDFVSVQTSNVAMNKIDLFLKRSLDYDVSWDRSTGALNATATITLTNEAPSSGLPNYVIGNIVGANRPGGVNLPDGWNYVFVTFYTPWARTGATLDGEELAMEELPELGRRAMSTFVPIPPGGTRTIVISLEGVLEEADYVLDLGVQPLVTPEQVSVSIAVPGAGSLETTGPVSTRGQSVEGAFPLVSDVEITVGR